MVCFFLLLSPFPTSSPLPQVVVVSLLWCSRWLVYAWIKRICGHGNGWMGVCHQSRDVNAHGPILRASSALDEARCKFDAIPHPLSNDGWLTALTPLGICTEGSELRADE